MQFLSQNNAKKAFLLAAFIYLFNGIGNVSQGILIKHYSNKLSINLYMLICLRCVVESIFLLPFSFERIKFLTKNTKSVGIITVLALFYSMDMLLWNTGLKTVPANNATLIMLLVPVWITLLGYFFLKEKGNFGLINLISLLLCFVSVAIIVKGDVSAGRFSSGYLFIFANTIFISVGLVLQKKFQDVRPVIFAIFTNSIALGIVSFALSNKQLPTFSWELVIALVFIGFFDFLEFFAVYVAYKMTDVALLQPIRFMRIVFSMVISYAVLGETTSKNQIIATVVILIANILPLVRMCMIRNKK